MQLDQGALFLKPVEDEAGPNKHIFAAAQNLFMQQYKTINVKMSLTEIDAQS